MHRFNIQFIYILLLFFVVISCSRKDNNEISTDLIHIPATAEISKKEPAMPKFEFERIEHNFGTLKQGEQVSFTYKFKNIGKANLIISTVVPGCGCTVAQFTKTPVKPGDSGFITVRLNTENNKGLLRKQVAVQANTYPAETKLWFTANVELP
ncbi:MAG: DUF1573 domain-containing protein [Bacteroidales bacterium]|nr:DUF1573 domain-containing protein [Bacteroidales bacterium]MDD3330066.1 DUF1573 domain-containing protein [Bacteroidales bacterium]MDD3691976.1 DUF1573 domain-containing protein [Bacteroidales bacterium]MDD4581521.1 DUF1573 domain-containing protein [Bacteroidales bacterium]MDX9889316.1 DUF1573 domain-containing protein [Bacteroidales bacterium]